MRNKWIYSAVLAASVSLGATAFAADRDPDVDKALKKRYPEAQTEIVNTHNVNGVKVSEVRVKTKDGESTAEVTEFGDFLIYGVPRKSSDLNKEMSADLKGLFKNFSGDADVYRVTNYYADVPAGKRTYRLRFDATGRLKDIQDVSESRKTEYQGADRAPDDITKKIDPVAKRYIGESAKIQGVFKDPNNEGFYLVNAQENGLDRKLVVNEEGRVLSFRDEIKSGELPPPVKKSLEDMFDVSKVAQTFRGEYQFYEFDTKSSGGEAMTIRLRPNGEVVSVQPTKNVDEAEQAVVAKHKQSKSSDNKSSKSKS